MSKEKIIETAEKLIKAGKIDKAIKEYQKLLAENPSDMRTKLKIGDLYSKNRDIPGAIRIYREVADHYAAESFHLKAIAVYKNILKLSPTAVEVNEKLGDLYRQVGLDNDAVNQFYIVASTYDGKGMVKEAMAVRKKIVEIDPGNTTGRIRLAELLQADGKTEESIKEYEKIAELLSVKKDRDGLIEVYEKMLYFRPDNVDMLKHLVQIYFEKRDFKKALRRLETAPEAIRKSLPITELWAEALLEDRQVDAARRKFRDLYEQALTVKQSETAARLYSRILQEFGDDQDYLEELSEIQKRTGDGHKKVGPKYRQDFEKTEMVDLNKLDQLLKKK